ncbi:MAG TPA: DUF2510 domain-containing protein [Acidimicrobiales bacterium]|nr:DUF2510 domain-containing protein [Acidimicrobiales bacterium]
MTAAAPTPPPGWYPEPATPGVVRYWSGHEWTGYTASAVVPPRPRSAAERIERALTWLACGATWLVTGVAVLVSPLLLLSDAPNAGATATAGFEAVMALLAASVVAAVASAGGWEWPRRVRVGVLLAGWALAAAAFVHLQVVAG